MTVKEFIKELKKYPPDDELALEDWSEQYCSPTPRIDIGGYWKDTRTGKSYLIIGSV